MFKKKRGVYLSFSLETQTQDKLFVLQLYCLLIFSLCKTKKSLFVLLQKKYYVQTKFLTHHEPMNVLFPCYVSGQIRQCPKTEWNEKGKWMDEYTNVQHRVKQQWKPQQYNLFDVFRMFRLNVVFVRRSFLFVGGFKMYKLSLKMFQCCCFVSAMITVQR